MSATPFDSPIGPVATRFLALKRALGRGYAWRRPARRI
jgi:hypothetical protein